MTATPAPEATRYPCYCLPGPARCDDPFNWCDRVLPLENEDEPCPVFGEGPCVLPAGHVGRCLR